MRTSEVLHGRLSAIAASLLLLAFLWAAPYLVGTSRLGLRLYRTSFDGAVAHKFAAALSRANHRTAVLLLGASTTRDGFDDELMSQVAPSLTFANGGTGLGSVFVYEALAEMTHAWGVHPAVLAMAFHPVALADRSINFDGAGYTDFFDRWHGREVLEHDDPQFVPADRREALINTLWPAHRFARQTSRLVRYALFRLHERWYWGEVLPRPAFERAPGDLLPQPRYFYSDPGPVPGAAELGVRWFQETTTEWAAPRHLASLRRSLDHALAASPRVVVVLMPEHSLLRHNLTSRLRAPFLAVVEDYRSRGVQVLDESDAIPDDLFRDSAHPIAEGRARFSQRMAPVLAAIAGAPPRGVVE